MLNFASEPELFLTPLAEQYGLPMDQVKLQLYDVIVQLWLNG